ncbi:MAG: serine--tRNA ligase [candidate division NC10 bacterium]|nr:serine--tRNA ligase [candidate division NC10 bacterium]
MLDPRIIREKPDLLRRKLHDRGVAFDVDGLLHLEAERRRLLGELERLRARKNALSAEVGKRKRAGEDAAALVAEAAGIEPALKELTGQQEKVQEQFDALLLTVPNLPHESVPVGPDPSANREVRRWGRPREFAFAPRPHWELGEALGILDFERGARLAQARFAVLTGAGARLERGLIQFMLDLHTREHGYTEVVPPLLVNAAAMTGSGQLPKFEEELFKTKDECLYLIPTAEVPLTNLHREEILPPGSLPKKYTAATPCFRREAGSYGKDVRGLIRQHQFNKVELVWFTEVEKSYEALERLTADAEEVLRRLELPYRVVALSTGDLGFASAKTYDLEVWLPGHGEFREISSCSNCEDFQARRAGIRYRPHPKAGAEYAHTLNGSGLAIGRTWIALLENFQEADGSVTVPDALRPYLDGQARLAPR